MAVTIFVLLGVLGLAVVTDLREHRIPNWVCGIGIVAGIILQLLDGVAPGPLLASIIGPFLLLIGFYALGGMGAGDVKLSVAAGALLGWPGALWSVGFTLIVGSMVGVAIFLKRAGIDGFFARYRSAVMNFARTTVWDMDNSVERETAMRRFPYAIAIAIGSLLALAVTR